MSSALDAVGIAFQKYYELRQAFMRLYDEVEMPETSKEALSDIEDRIIEILYDAECKAHLEETEDSSSDM